MLRRFIQCALLAVAATGCSNMRRSSAGLENADALGTVSSEEEVKQIIATEERKQGIPNGILNSIAAVESRHKPYAVNARQKAHNFGTKDEAVKFVNASLKSGCDNISVGCLQLHYKTHRKKFTSLDDMLTPESNASYAAGLLKSLYNRYGSWEMAIRMYHTKKARYNKRYYKKVMRAYNSIYRAS